LDQQAWRPREAASGVPGLIFRSSAFPFFRFSAFPLFRFSAFPFFHPPFLPGPGLEWMLCGRSVLLVPGALILHSWVRYSVAVYLGLLLAGVLAAPRPSSAPGVAHRPPAPAVSPERPAERPSAPESDCPQPQRSVNLRR